MNTKQLGKVGEDSAARHLQNNGYKILQRNFHSKLGEIDIVALDGNILVFVEVKTRWSKAFGIPEEAITPWKLRRLTKAGEYYKLLHPKLPEALRIDCAAVDLSPTGEIGEIRIIKNLTS